jgi:uncharacterized membrane protein
MHLPKKMMLNKVDPCIQWFIVLFPTLWLVGLHVNDLARIAACVSLVYVIATRKKHNSISFDATPLQPLILGAFLLFLTGFAVFAFTECLFPVFGGSHGIDFAIFTQVVDSINRFRQPLTSLVSTDWTNFLSHHFVPFLYVPAFLAKLGMPAYLAISLVHGFGVITAGILFYLLSRNLKFSQFMSLTFVLLLFANPTVRHGLFYGVHDEIFSLPFLMLAFWGWQARRIGLTCIALLSAATTKESISAVGIALILAIFLDDRLLGKRDHALTRRDTFLLISTFALLFVLFVGYFFLQPLVLGKSFDHISKLGSVSELLQWENLRGKMWFYLFLLLPLLLFPLWFFQFWHLFLPCIPLLGIIFVSKFQDMWAPLNYYGVVPSFLLYASSLIALSRSTKIQRAIARPALVALMICVAFSWSTKKPIVRLPTYSAEQLAIIPSDALVVTSPAAALFLFRVKRLWRLGNVGNNPPTEFDFVVRKTNDLEELETKLSSLVELCYRTDLWEIYCHRQSTLRLQTP